ncbi:olfactory receptor 11L1-like [Discoglossus pictus]
MYEKNQTSFNQIILLGFQNLGSFRIVFFILILWMYCITISGNFLIIMLVSISKNLLSPMYFFLTQLSISDIMLTTNIVPNMLHIVLNEGGAISVSGCIVQFYFFGALEISECFLLTVMSYDRYLAICNPLRYSYIMDHALCLRFVITSWLLSFSVILISAVTICTLHFCGTNVIDHFFCDLAPLLELSCSDTYIVKLEGVFMSIPVIILPFILIITSYTNIIHAILKIPSNTRRQKTFSTCSSHLAVVSIYYGTLFAIYVVPTKGQSLTESKVFSLLYTVVTPLINPIIYSLRNKEIKDALNRCFCKMNKHSLTINL